MGADADFAEFFGAVWTDLSSFARSVTGDAHGGDELAQEALARVYARFALLTEPRAYAFRIVTNLARAQWKATHRESETWQALPTTDRAEAPDVDLLDAVHRLKPAYRDVLLLHYWSDLKVEEIARVLRRPSGTVKRRLAEARAALNLALEGAR